MPLTRATSRAVGKTLKRMDVRAKLMLRLPRSMVRASLERERER